MMGKVSDLRRSHADAFGPVSFEPYSKDGQTITWPAQATWASNMGIQCHTLASRPYSVNQAVLLISHDFQMLGSVQRTWTAWTA